MGSTIVHKTTTKCTRGNGLKLPKVQPAVEEVLKKRGIFGNGHRSVENKRKYKMVF
jgi:hypothetical protein